MFVISIKHEEILTLKVKLTINEVSIVKSRTAIAFISVDLNIVDICSPVKDFEKSSQKGHQRVQKQKNLEFEVWIVFLQ